MSKKVSSKRRYRNKKYRLNTLPQEILIHICSYFFLISIWLCPDSKDKLYLQNIINHLSDIHNSVPFFPHCTLLSGIKLNTTELTYIHIQMAKGSFSTLTDTYPTQG